MEICKEKQDQQLVVIRALAFFPRQNFYTDSATLEIKIKEVLNPRFGAFHGLWRTKSAGLE